MPLKFGTFSQTSGEIPHIYPKHYEIQTTQGGRRRLAIAASESPINLLKSLIIPNDDYFSFLYVLKVPRTEDFKPGRYQAPWMTLNEAQKFLNEFGSFFETDARHDLWMFSDPSQTQIVYDKHEILYYYGDIGAPIPVLSRAGYSEGTFKIPCPHFHFYNSECDAQLEKLMELEWDFHPLLDQDYE